MSTAHTINCSPHMAGKPCLRTDGLHFKILIPIWGERYINDFFALCALSIFNPKNSAIFNKFKSCEIVFLTSQASAPFIRGIELLHDYNVKFIYIDDLLKLEQYGLTLTIACARAIISSSTKQIETAFAFINCDFILSDNAFALIFDKLNAGYNAVLCPSLRGVREDLQEFDSTDLSARNLAKFCLQHPHPRTVGGIINQDVVYSNLYMSFYLKPVADILLDLSMNPVAMCIKPEVEYTRVYGYIDYSFMPSMVPSNNYYYVTDSDEMFIMEIAPYEQEYGHVLLVEPYREGMLQRISLQLLQDKTLYSNYIYVIHSADIKFDLEKYKLMLRDYYNAVFAYFPPGFFTEYSLHDQHYFWLVPLVDQVRKGHLSSDTPEIDVDFAFKNLSRVQAMEKSRKAIFGKLNENKLSSHLRGLFATKTATHVQFNLSYPMLLEYQQAILEFVDKWQDKISISIKLNFSSVESKPLDIIYKLLNFGDDKFVRLDFPQRQIGPLQSWFYRHIYNPARRMYKTHRALRYVRAIGWRLQRIFCKEHKYTVRMSFPICRSVSR